MRQNQSGKSRIGNILYCICIVILIGVAFRLYHRFEETNFNEYIKTEYIPYTSQFLRDNQVKYTKADSYKIISTKENDAMFYQEIAVQKNTPYRVTCMVKTENVKTKKEISAGGAHISIANTVEKSESITGTNDWQKLEFIFNSKDRTSIKLGFRLGGYDDNCTGTAWFSDFKIEAGTSNTDTNWKVACFVIENTRVIVDNKQVSLQMTSQDNNDMKQNMERFKKSCNELSNHQMTVDYDFITISKPLTSLSYDNENGYYVAPENVKNLIQEYLNKEEYDHIFVAIRLGDMLHRTDILVNDWIGLGGMDYEGIGFSNIRLPNDDKNYTYKYHERINTFPEEVFVHEFLHTLERNSKEYGFTVPALHDYQTYGYQDEKLIGQKKWYQDYMNSTVKTSSEEKIGLNPQIYQLKPNHASDFEFSYQMNALKEPANVLEEFVLFFRRIGQNIEVLANKKEGNTQ